MASWPPRPCAEAAAGASVEDAIRRHVEYLNARRENLYEVVLYSVLVYEGWSQQRPKGSRARNHCTTVARRPRSTWRRALTGAQSLWHHARSFGRLVPIGYAMSLNNLPSRP